MPQDTVEEAGWLYHPGDWPPRGCKVRQVALALGDGSRWRFPEGSGRPTIPTEALHDGEAPIDAATRLAERLAAGPVAWQPPVGVLARPEEATDRTPSPATLVFAARAAGASAAWPSALGMGEGSRALPAAIAGALGEAASAALAAPWEGALWTEWREHVLSSPSFFHCRLVRREENCALLEYISRRQGTIKDVAVPAGSRTYALYREGADWVGWRIVGPSGEDLCRLVHLAGDVRLGEDRVRYRDLLLDVLERPGGVPEIIDQEDLSRAEAEGLLSRAEADRILRAGERVAAEFDRLLAAALPS